MDNWNKLSIKDKANYIKLGVSNGIRDLNTIRDTYNNVYAEGGYTLSLEDVERGKRIKQLIDQQNKERNINFVNRLQQSNPKYILGADVDDEGNISVKPGNVKLGYATANGGAVIYPNIQEINGRLIDFTLVPGISKWLPYDTARKFGDYVELPEGDAAWWTDDHYKHFYPLFEKYGFLQYGYGGNLFDEGGSKDIIDRYKGFFPWLSREDAIKIARLAVDNRKPVVTFPNKNNSNQSKPLKFGPKRIPGRFGSFIYYNNNLELAKAIQKENLKKDPSENFLNDLMFTVATFGGPSMAAKTATAVSNAPKYVTKQVTQPFKSLFKTSKNLYNDFRHGWRPGLASTAARAVGTGIQYGPHILNSIVYGGLTDAASYGITGKSIGLLGADGVEYITGYRPNEMIMDMILNPGYRFGNYATKKGLSLATYKNINPGHYWSYNLEQTALPLVKDLFKYSYMPHKWNKMPTVVSRGLSDGYEEYAMARHLNLNPKEGLLVTSDKPFSEMVLQKILSPYIEKGNGIVEYKKELDPEIGWHRKTTATQDKQYLHLLHDSKGGFNLLPKEKRLKDFTSVDVISNNHGRINAREIGTSSKGLPIYKVTDIYDMEAPIGGLDMGNMLSLLHMPHLGKFITHNWYPRDPIIIDASKMVGGNKFKWSQTFNPDNFYDKLNNVKY